MSNGMGVSSMHNESVVVGVNSNCFVLSGNLVVGELLNEFVFEDKEEPAPDKEDMDDVSKLVDKRSLLSLFCLLSRRLEDGLVDSDFMDLDAE